MYQLFAAVLLAIAAIGVEAQVSRPSRPIILEKSGGFSIGGKTVTAYNNFTKQMDSLTCDWGYLEYFIPWRPRKSNLVMWHSSSTQVFQNRWDGGEGYKDIMLRRNYPVWLWEGPRVGRANWGCDPYLYMPGLRDNGNWAAWNFGPTYGTWWPDVQFPTNDTEAWKAATRTRYQEFDTEEDVVRHAEAAAVAADSGKIGKDIVYLTNSAGGLRAMMTTTKANRTNIKGIVTYESIGYVFPDNVNVTAGHGGFGPFVVPVEQFKKLANLTAIQFIWGDHRADNWTYVEQSRLCAKLINQYGGNATVLKLGDDAGLKGSTHIAFADMDNDKVAGLLENFLEDHGLDGYVDDDDNGNKNALRRSPSEDAG